MERLEQVVRRLWQRLLVGEKVEVPAQWIEPPAARTDLFRAPPAAWPMGQTCDFVWRLREGGRVHAQCFRTNGVPMIRFHLDRYDPDRSFGDWIRHAVHETPAGPILGAVAGVAVVAGVGALLVAGIKAVAESLDT